MAQSLKRVETSLWMPPDNQGEEKPRAAWEVQMGRGPKREKSSQQVSGVEQGKVTDWTGLLNCLGYLKKPSWVLKLGLIKCF